MDGRPLRLDSAAESSNPELPAFLARPAGAPAYHGFPLVEETRTDDWCFGAITEFSDPSGCEAGDGFVVAPDGSRAGLVWQVGDFEIAEVCPPDEKRWGVYSVPFAKRVRNTADLADCFRLLLPRLKELHAAVKRNG
jgi:hypothetical protein